MSNHSAEATGGCGAGYKARIQITEEGIYNLIVGKGGYSIHGGGGTHAAENGEDSKIIKNGTTLLNVGGGSKATTTTTSATAGTGGKIKTNNLNEIEVYTKTNGNNGTKAGKGGVAKSPAAPIPGHTWGQSGQAKAYYSGGNVSPGYHGYMKIVYKGKAS